MPNPDTQITLEIEGTPQDDGYLRLSDFLAQLGALRTSLNAVNDALARLKKLPLYYRIVDLSRVNGARVVIEPVTRKATPESNEAIQLFHDRFFQELTAISDNKPLSEEVNNHALESFQKLVERNGKGFANAIVHNTTASIKLDDKFRATVTKLIGRTRFSHGSLTGELGKINVHGRAQNFWIFPHVGPSKVLCKFVLPDVREKAKSSIEKMVTVTGKKHYRPDASFPYRIDVTGLEVVEPRKDKPSLYDLGGIAPDATGDKTAVEFIRDIRNEWS